MNSRKKSALLSINIPIYKRPDLLEACLTRTIAEIRDHCIEINLFDDSIDNTNDKVIQRLKSHYRFIEHRKNKINLGIDKNIDQALRLGATEYIWLLGEDDFILPGACEKVLAMIDRKKYSIIATNYEFVNNDLSFFPNSIIVKNAVDEELKSDELLSKFGWTMGFIGACIVRRDVVVGISPDRYVGTFFCHLGCIFEGGLGRDCVFISSSLVANRSEGLKSVSWRQQALDVYFGMERLFLMLSPPYSEVTIQHALKSAAPALPFRSIRGLASLRADGLFGLKNFKLITARRPIRLKLAGAAISLVPISLLRHLKRVKQSARHS